MSTEIEANSMQGLEAYAANAGRHSQIVITTLRPTRGAGALPMSRLSGEPLCVSRQPFLDGARKLLARGHDRRTMLVMRWAGAKEWALRGPLGAAAKLTVDEHNGTFAKWKPLSRSAVPPGNANSAAPPPKGRAAEKAIPESTAEKAGERTKLDSTRHCV